MNERRRPPRRGRGTRPNSNPAVEPDGEDNPYREASPAVEDATEPVSREVIADIPERAPQVDDQAAPRNGSEPEGASAQMPVPSSPPAERTRPEAGFTPQQGGGHPRDPQGQNGRRGRRNRGRGRRDPGQVVQPDRAPVATGGPPPAPMAIVATGETTGWFDPARDGGFIRRAQASYLADAGDAYVPPHIVRQYALRKSDEVTATTGRDPRGRTALVEVTKINGADPAESARRPEFNTLIATYPERKLTLETGRPAKAGAELIRRAIDLIAPIGYGQRALIVAPARAGKTTLLHAITEGIALKHPEASLLILLVDERPEEVSEAISWGVGEVIASSFDQPAARHVEVTEMVLERARRLVETGKDVVIVLDSLTRMARAHNTAERGTGRTMSGGLDAQAMAKPKAFFGSARAVAPSSGGGSLTIIATALVETGSRMDDIIFEEFKGTGNCEIKLDRSLAEKRIYPAIDIATSGTRREEKLFRPDQLDHVYTLRRGLGQMPPQSGMEWLIKRIANTPDNDTLLSGL
jgi:transcription termination factor Rho